MSYGDLTQAEADALMAMEKHRADNSVWRYPREGDAVTIPLLSLDRHEEFLLDLSRGRINLMKVKYQERARNVEVLVRLELDGPPHRNPDDTEIACPHIHVYKEGYGVKWAMPLPQDTFSNLSDVYKTLDEFMAFCNVKTPPRFRKTQTELPL
jgi:hypothetical protein